MRRYERASTMLTSNRPVEDWGKLLGDAAAVSAMLEPKPTCHHRRWQVRTFSVPNGQSRWPVLK
jgi:DNA replication protein DnaC